MAVFSKADPEGDRRDWKPGYCESVSSTINRGSGVQA